MVRTKTKPVDQGIVLTAAVTILLIFFTLWTVNAGYSFMRYAGIVILALLGIFMKVERTLCMLALLLPFEMVFKIPGSYTVLPILISICVIKLFVLSRKMLDSFKFMAFALLALLSVLASVLAFGSFFSVVPFFVYILFFMLCLRDLKDKLPDLFVPIAVLFVIGSLLFCFGALLFPNAVKVIAPAAENIYSTRFYGFSTEWDTGRTLVVSVAFLIALYMKMRKHLLILVAVAGVMLYFLVQTQLYSGLIGLVIVLLILPFVGNASRKQYATRFFGMLVFLIIAGVVGYFFVFRTMLSLRGTIDDNGRFDIWLQYLKSFFSSLRIMFIGVGAGNISHFAAQSGQASAHNILIEKMIEFGFVGLTMLIALLVSVFKGFEMRAHRNLHMLPLIAFLGTTLTQGTSGSEVLFFLMIVCMMPRAADAVEAPSVQDEAERTEVAPDHPCPLPDASALPPDN